MMFYLDPEARLDFSFDWTDWLEVDETIASFTVTASTGVTLDETEPPTDADGIITYWLHQGTAGVTAVVTCHVVTSAGRQDDRTARIRVMQR